MITKNISIGTLEINPEQGKIWLNCPNCILRIKGLDFKLVEEKFSMIDIIDNKAWMVPGNLHTLPIGEFIEEIATTIFPKIIEIKQENRKKLMDKLLILIKDEVDKCQY